MLRFVLLGKENYILCYKSTPSALRRRFDGTANRESTFFSSWKAAEQAFSLHLPGGSDLAGGQRQNFPWRRARHASEPPTRVVGDDAVPCRWNLAYFAEHLLA